MHLFSLIPFILITFDLLDFSTVIRKLALRIKKDKLLDDANKLLDAYDKLESDKKLLDADVIENIEYNDCNPTSYRYNSRIVS